jgi:hypothetical protein
MWLIVPAGMPKGMHEIPEGWATRRGSPPPVFGNESLGGKLSSLAWHSIWPTCCMQYDYPKDRPRIGTISPCS